MPPISNRKIMRQMYIKCEECKEDILPDAKDEQKQISFVHIKLSNSEEIFSEFKAEGTAHISYKTLKYHRSCLPPKYQNNAADHLPKNN